MAEPDERSSAEVCDEEGDLPCTQCRPEVLAQHIGGGDGGGVLDRREEIAEVQPR